jgi:hypothetical protein
MAEQRDPASIDSHVGDDDGRYLPVLAEAPEARPTGPPSGALDRPAASLPVPAAAVGGFVAGVAAYVFVRFLRAARRSGHLLPIRRRSRGLRRRRQAPLEIASTRSFLVDVHLLRR